MRSTGIYIQAREKKKKAQAVWPFRPRRSCHGANVSRTYDALHNARAIKYVQRKEKQVDAAQQQTRPASLSKFRLLHQLMHVRSQ